MIKFENFKGKYFISLSSIKLPIYQVPLSIFLKTYITGIAKGGINSRAAAISFSFFMAFFPFLLFIVSFIAYIPVDGFQNYLLDLIKTVMPKALFELSEQTILDVLNVKRVNLLSISGFLTLVFNANGISSIISGLNYSYHKFDVHTALYQYGISLILAIFFSFTFIFWVTILIFGKIFTLTLAQFQDTNLSYLFLSIKYFILFALFFLVVCILFYFSRKKHKKGRFLSLGAFFSSIAIVFSSYSFSFYILNFSKYNQLYGSIGSLLLVLVWLYLNSFIVLLGFEFDVSIEKTIRINYRNNKKKLDK